MPEELVNKNSDFAPGSQPYRQGLKVRELPNTVLERLNKLAQLPENWDSYGANSIKQEAISRTTSILHEVLAIGAAELPLPFIAPSPDGGIELEWKTEYGKELLLDIPPEKGDLSFLLVEPTSSGEENEIEGTVGEGYTLNDLIQQLAIR